MHKKSNHEGKYVACNIADNVQSASHYLKINQIYFLCGLYHNGP